jgi:hypothetical protein
MLSDEASLHMQKNAFILTTEGRKKDMFSQTYFDYIILIFLLKGRYVM